MNRLESLLRASRARDLRAEVEAIERRAGDGDPPSTAPRPPAREDEAELRFHLLVHAFRASERQAIRDALERHGPRPRVLRVSPSLARRLFDRVGPNLAFEGVPVYVDPSLPESEFRIH